MILRTTERGLIVVRADEQHRELVAAEPADRIVAAHGRADPRRDLREHLVAGLVAVLEVDAGAGRRRRTPRASASRCAGPPRRPRARSSARTRRASSRRSADRAGCVASRRSPSATSRRWLASHDSSRVRRAAIALRSVRSAAREPAAGVGHDRDQARDLGRARAQRVGDHRARLRAADDHGAGRGRRDPRGAGDLRAIGLGRVAAAPRSAASARRRATTRCSRAR